MTRLRPTAFVFLVTAILAGCTEGTADPTTTNNTPAAEAPLRLTVTVGPQRADCQGLIPMKCLVVDGQLFYDGIEGFTHKAGTTYELEIERSPRGAPGQIFHDVGYYRYSLIRVISETP